MIVKSAVESQRSIAAKPPTTTPASIPPLPSLALALADGLQSDCQPPLPEPVVQALLRMDANDLDLLLQSPLGIKAQVTVLCVMCDVHAEPVGHQGTGDCMCDA